MKFLNIHLLAVVLVLSSMNPVDAQQAPNAQNTNQPPKVEGTVTEVKEQGRTKSIVVTNDQGQTLEIPLNRVSVDIKGNGDKGFVQKGAYIGAEGVLTNDMIFVTTVNVLVPPKGQKLPRGKVSKAPRRAGNSQNTYQVVGTIQALQANPDYPDYTMLAIDAPGKFPVINLEKNYQVKVVAMDPELIEVGQTVELEGRVLRGKFVPSKITVNRKEAFKSEEVFPSAEGGKSAEEK